MEGILFYGIVVMFSLFFLKELFESLSFTTFVFDLIFLLGFYYLFMHNKNLFEALLIFPLFFLLRSVVKDKLKQTNNNKPI